MAGISTWGESFIIGATAGRPYLLPAISSAKEWNTMLVLQIYLSLPDITLQRYNATGGTRTWQPSHLSPVRMFMKDGCWA
jgi:hypothetical protein